MALSDVVGGIIVRTWGDIEGLVEQGVVAAMYLCGESIIRAWAEFELTFTSTNRTEKTLQTHGMCVGFERVPQTWPVPVPI